MVLFIQLSKKMGLRTGARSMGPRLGSLDGRYGDYSVYVLSAGKFLQHHDIEFLVMLSLLFRVKITGAAWLLNIPHLFVD